MTHLDSIGQSGIDLFPRHPWKKTEILWFQFPPPDAECGRSLCKRRFDPIIDAGRESFHHVFDDVQWKYRSRVVDIFFIVWGQLLLYIL